MKTKAITLTTAIVFAGVYAFTSCNNNSMSKAEAKQTKQDTIDRGKYLVMTIGCGDCHSPKIMTDRGPVPDTTRELSGHPADQPLPPVDKGHLKTWVLFNPIFTASVGPWGVSYAANLTSDESGIGNWTEEQWLTAIRKGKYKGMESNRDLLPPMPWPNFAKMNDDDLKAIFVYLKSTKPVKNVVPPARSLDQL